MIVKRILFENQMHALYRTQECTLARANDHRQPYLRCFET